MVRATDDSLAVKLLQVRPSRALDISSPVVPIIAPVASRCIVPATDTSRFRVNKINSILPVRFIPKTTLDTRESVSPEPWLVIPDNTTGSSPGMVHLWLRTSEVSDIAVRIPVRDSQVSMLPIARCTIRSALSLSLEGLLASPPHAPTSSDPDVPSILGRSGASTSVILR